MSLGPVEFDNTSATFTNVVIISGDNQAVSCTLGSGAFRVAGGASVNKNFNVGGDTCVTGNLTATDIHATDIYATDIYATDIYATSITATSGIFDTLSAISLTATNITSDSISTNTLSTTEITIANEVLYVEKGPTLSVNLPYSEISIIFDDTKIDVVNEKPYDIEINNCRNRITGSPGSVDVYLSAYQPDSAVLNHGVYVGNITSNGVTSLSTPITAFANGGRIQIHLVNPTDVSSFTFSASSLRRV